MASLTLLASSPAAARTGADAAGGYRDGILAAAPVAYWRLGEAGGTVVLDETAGDHRGTYLNGVALGVPGALGTDPSTAARFDGGNDLVSFGDPADGTLDFGAGDFTAEAWVKPGANDERALIGKRDATRYWQVTVTDDPNHAGQLRANVNDGTVVRQVYSTRRVDDGAWHHVVVRFDRDVGISIYIDAVAAGSGNGPMPGDVGNTGALQLAKLPGYPNYRGDIDEVALYRTVLTPAQIQEHFYAGSLDVTAPAVSLTAPTAGSYLAGSTTTFSGTAGTIPGDEASVTVKVYAGSVPSGTPAQTLTAARAADGTFNVSTPLADGTWTAVAEQRDDVGNAGTSAPATFVVDTRAPVATISSGPASPSGTSAALFAFAADESDVSYLCSVDSAPAAACSSPHSAAVAGDGTHRFEVVARDRAGNSSAPAAWTWTVDATAPVTTISSSPPSPSSSGDAAFTFAADDPAATFTCTLDGGAPAACTSPQAYSGLADGTHSFSVRAADAAGNVGADATYTWRIQGTGLAAPSITDSPPPVTRDSGATLAFSHPAQVAFECSLDGAAAGPCTSPVAYVGLGEGPHTFRVIARSADGREQSALRTWTVDTTGPAAPSIASGPPPVTRDTAATFDFTGADAPGSAAHGAALPPLLPESTGPEYTVSPAGSDGNPGSAAAPWRTIQHALDTVGPGARVLVRAGTYAESLRMRRSGLPGAPITIEAQPGEEVVLRQSPIGGNNDFPLGVVDTASYVRFRGFVIENALGGTTTNVYIADFTHHVELSDSEIRGSEGQGIYTGELTHHVYLLRNWIHDNGSLVSINQDHGIYIEGDDHLVAGNLIVDQRHGFGIQVYDLASRTIATSNTVIRSGKSGLVLGGSGGVDGIVVVNNVFAFNEQYGVAHDEVNPTNSRIDHNVLFANDWGAIQPGFSGVDFSGGNLTGDPLFVSVAAGDYRLRAGSPATARALTEYAYALDPDARLRPQGGGFEIGAYESAAALECALDGAPFGACSSPQAYAGLASGAHAFQVRVVDDAGNGGTPAAHAWTVDTVPPTTTIAAGPPPLSASASASFSLTADEAGVSFECRLDGGAFAPCAPEHSTGSLADGPHQLEARATDPAGNTGPPATRAWTIDTTPPPPPPITAGPPSVTRATSASVSWGSSEAGATFACSLDGAAAAPCTSPWGGSGLADGDHELAVSAVDAAGNASAPAVRGWTVDTRPPATSIDSAPRDPTNALDATFAFSADEPVARFECVVDGVAAGTCSSPFTVSGVAEGAHTFGVRAVDAAGNEGTSATRGWTVDRTAPTATLTQVPPDPSTSRDASFAFGSGEGGSTFECRLDGGAYAACASPHSLTALADGPHAFSMRATDAAGNVGTAAGHSWEIDATPPAAPTIDTRPSDPTASRDASFAFGGGEPGGTFECSLDGATFATCASPAVYSALADGAHRFEVRSRDRAGNAGPAAAAAWTIDGTGPVTTITSAPSGPTTDTGATFAFTSNESGATFACRIDGGAFASCATPQAYTGLGDGSHTFEVRATDPVGNVGPAATHSWTVDTTAPGAPTIESRPPDPSTSRSASFGFSGGEPGDTFECSLDGATFATCSSPAGYSSLADGPHRFEVRARDAAGNTGAAAAASWTIDATSPVTTIGSGPANPTTETGATFTFSASEPGSTFSCRLDGAAFATCTSPHSYSALAAGAHTFEVRATDAAGNTGAAATYGWTISAPPPPPPPGGSGYRAAVLADSPRAYWRLGEAAGTAAADEVGSAAGTYESGVVLGAAGAIVADTDTAARFDGTDDKVGMGDPSSGALDFGTSDFTLEAWVKTTVNGERTVLSKHSSGRSWQFTVTDDSGYAGRIRVNVADGSATRQVYGPTLRVDDGAWHHVAVVVDRDVGITIYVDGTAASTAGTLTGNIDNAGPFLVGKASGYAYFRGDIDEVAVYASALPAARVQAHLTAGRGG